MNFFPSQMERMGRRTGKILRRSKVPKGDDFLDDMDKYFEPKTERTTINPESETSSQLIARQNDSKDSLNDLLNFLEPESPIDDEVQKSFKAISSIKKKTNIIEGLSSDKKLYDILKENTFFNKLIKKNNDLNNYNSDDDDKMSFPSTSSDEEKENFLVKTEHVDKSNIDHLKEIKSLTQKYNNDKNKEIIEFIKSPSVTEIPLMPDKNKIEEIEKIALVISEKIKNKLPENFNNINTKKQYENKKSFPEIIEKNQDKTTNIEEIKEKENIEIIENNITQKNKPEKPNSLIEIIENTKKSEQINNKTKKTKKTKKIIQEKTKKKKTVNNDNVIISQETTETIENKLNTDHQNTLIHDNLKYEEYPISEYNNPDLFDNLPIQESNESVKNNIPKHQPINKSEIQQTKNKKKISQKKSCHQNEEKLSESPKNTLKSKENKLSKQDKENYFKEEDKTNKPNSKNKKKNMKENNSVNIIKTSKSNPKKKGYTERELAIKAYNQILETGKTQLKQIIKTNENFGNENRYPCRFRLPRICYWRSDPVFIEKNAEGKEVLNYYKLEEDNSLIKYLQPTKRSRGGTRKLKKNSKKTEINNENPEIISEDSDSIVSLIKLKNEENREFGRNIYGPIFCTILKCQNFKLNVRFPDKLITLSRGDKFVIPPNTVYSMENLSKKSIVEISCKIMK